MLTTSETKLQTLSGVPEASLVVLYLRQWNLSAQTH